jgi:hypothetical protein
MGKIRKMFTRDVFDGLIGVVLVFYALGIFIKTILLEIVSPDYILNYMSWLEIILGLLIIYVSKDKIEKLKW